MKQEKERPMRRIKGIIRALLGLINRPWVQTTGDRVGFWEVSITDLIGLGSARFFRGFVISL